MKVVFDTNVVVAGIVTEGLCREILEIHLPEHDAILSQALWDELLTTLKRKLALVGDACSTEKAYYPVTKLCRWLGVTPSGYHAWRQRPESAHAQMRSPAEGTDPRVV